MSEEIKERLEAMAKVMPPSFYGTVTGALALITSLTAELTAARAEVERLQDDLMEYRLAVTEMDSLAAGPGGLVAPLATLKKIAAIGERALTPAEEGPRIVEGARMPYFCPACQAIPKHGYCNLPGCLTRPAEEGERG